MSPSLLLSSSFLLFILPLSVYADEKFLTQVLCRDCTKSDLCNNDTNSITYVVPSSRCYNPQLTFPSDSGSIWGPYDILDTCGPSVVETSLEDSSLKEPLLN
ncbi:hypothetical protein TrRE_jg3422 [Triparma retinervis]|uniref:Uncharacterized protein n=1 Tax=Triparma retinervis TaxID=2557542 RepID=A0A9W7AFF5_9STRA|nr:hypothetical protein TrRE_jg3422 [Triparma retinervis]